MSLAQAFCHSVATFRSRTWKDALPLVDLLRGVLLYLLQHYTWGAALLKERAVKDVSAWGLQRVAEGCRGAVIGVYRATRG